MKIFKILLLFFVIILTSSCTNTNNYENIVNNLELINIENIDNYPFNIEINIEKITEEEILYSLTIDEVEEEMYDINAIIIHDKETNDIFPSIGIVDKPLTLTYNSKEKGLNLIGFIDYKDNLDNFKGTFKVKITFKNKDNEIKTFYYIKQY